MRFLETLVEEITSFKLLNIQFPTTEFSQLVTPVFKVGLCIQYKGAYVHQCSYSELVLYANFISTIDVN